MSRAKKTALKIIESIESGESVLAVKNEHTTSDDEWYRCSSKAYNIYLERANQKTKTLEKKRRKGFTSRRETNDLFIVSEKLAKYALLPSVLTTLPELNQLKIWIEELPESETKIIDLIKRVTMHPKYRSLQRDGRFKKLPYFNECSLLIDAALLAYYRSNFISSYLSLVPVIEGILIRWMGYSNESTKPKFRHIKEFFNASYKRQPCPYNIQFHKIYTQTCHNIIFDHFFKATNDGQSYSDFNRHIASHFLKDASFATRDNCIRLFLLLDAMSEILVCESRINDPRWATQYNYDEIDMLTKLMLSNEEDGPEQRWLDSKIDDLL